MDEGLTTPTPKILEKTIQVFGKVKKITLASPKPHRSWWRMCFCLATNQKMETVNIFILHNLDEMILAQHILHVLYNILSHCYFKCFVNVVYYLWEKMKINWRIAWTNISYNELHSQDHRNGLNRGILPICIPPTKMYLKCSVIRNLPLFKKHILLLEKTLQTLKTSKRVNDF